MRKGLTEMVFILDRSGSMHGLEGDTIGGFNSMLEKQRRVEGSAYITTVLFDMKWNIVHDRVPLSEVRDMNACDYIVGGCTALLDAVGSTIKHIASIHKYARPEDIPERTVFIIITDGMENASHHYTADDVRHMIEKEEKKYGWEFLFLGANMDAVSTAASFGIRAERAVSYHSDHIGTRLNYEVAGDALCAFRETSAMPSEWKSRIEADMKTRAKSSD